MPKINICDSTTPNVDLDDSLLESINGGDAISEIQASVSRLIKGANNVLNPTPRPIR